MLAGEEKVVKLVQESFVKCYKRLPLLWREWWSVIGGSFNSKSGLLSIYVFAFVLNYD